MGKRCDKCGFLNNPDNANYCGKCGHNIADYGSIWKLYDSSSCKVLLNADFNEYKLLKDKRSETWIKKIKNIFSAVSTWYSKREYTFDAIGVSITAFMMFIGALILLKENVFVAILSFGLSVICGLSAYFIFKDRDS